MRSRIILAFSIEQVNLVDQTTNLLSHMLGMQTSNINAGGTVTVTYLECNVLVNLILVHKSETPEYRQSHFKMIIISLYDNLF